MSNYKMWNVRLRHEWLQSPLKPKRVKRGQRVRIGLQAALDRKQKPESQQTESDA